MDVFTTLVDTTLKMVNLLTVQYESGKISAEDFKVHTSIKIEFLNKHINEICNDKVKESVQNTIVSYNHISS